ncbi:MAG: S46 family peptidase, partial [Gemmatimonadota bacterium]|nr:S46 family peptidase [Gemmatimonadota bacterium]
MTANTTTRGLTLIVLGLLAAGCASGAASLGPVVDLAPQAAVPPGLEIPDAAAAAASTVELNGTEMGTMWTFENAPLDYWEETYGFRPSSEWLEHARLSSLRFGTFCSASFVSPDGLVMTNHHCARSCVDAVTTSEQDYLRNGFLARSRGEEPTCPGLQLDQLVEVSDVTEQLLGGAADALTPQERSEAIQLLSEELRASCEDGSGRVCQVVSLFNGGRYMLYEYERYPDVRLVFAPELQIGFFGGDPDNFTYPRYNLDVSFVRAYGTDGKPVSSEHFFAWNPEGPEEGEAVFVTGHPGSTSRQITVSQYMYERQIRHPLLLEFFDQRLETLRQVAARDPELGRQLSNSIFSLENTQKLFRGELQGLRSTDLTARKIRWEQDLRDRLSSTAEGSQTTDLWESMAEIQGERARLYPQLVIDSPNNLFASSHLQLAASIVNWVRQMQLPDDERGAPFRGDNAAGTRRQIESPGPIDVDQSRAMLAGRIGIAMRWLDDTDPLASSVRAGETAELAARRLIAGSQIESEEFRLAALAMTPEDLDAVGDPLIDLAGRLIDIGAAVGQQWTAVQERQSVESARFADAVFAAYGTDIPPDATFTLRISDGVVQRYPYNGTFAPPVTTLYGLFARSAEFGNQDPWTLPERWLKARDGMDLSTPLNFVSTNDITGGNSGSPLIDKDGRLVGIAFDGNVEAFPNEFLFAAPNGRTVSVHS